MRKLLIGFGLMLLPSALLAQSSLRVSSATGPIQWRPGSKSAFVSLTNNQAVQAGDEIRTGPGAQLILSVPDGSYMVVSENSKVVIDDFWSGNFRSIMNVMLGQVRFYIQRLGGRPSPYSVRTPTALIAVRGTTFNVMVDDALFSEVSCLEGRVTVESLGLPDREVILEHGFKTLVRPGEAPTRPAGLDADLRGTRIIRMQKKNTPELDANGMPPSNALATDNDRRNRTTDPQRPPDSRTNDNTQRAKPGTLSFPR